MSLLTQPVRIRRLVAGVAIIGCPLAGAVSSVFDAHEGTDTPGDALYGIAVTHSQGIWIAGLMFMLSAILTVPTAFGLLHLSAGRGATLGHLGAVFLILGGLGHMGYGTWQLMVAKIPGPGDRATLAAYFDRASALNGILLPMLMSIIVGLILAALAAHRSGLLPRWVPGLLIAVAVFDVVANSTALGTSKWTHVITWSVALVGLSYVGATVLRMSDRAWADLTHVSPTVPANKPCSPTCPDDPMAAKARVGGTIRVLHSDRPTNMPGPPPRRRRPSAGTTGDKKSAEPSSPTTLGFMGSLRNTRGMTHTPEPHEPRHDPTILHQRSICQPFRGS